MDIKDAKAKHRMFLLSLPNVTGVGIGQKIRDGKPVGTTAIKVFVLRKLPPAQLSDEDLIPETLEGFPTDVEVISSLKKRH